MNRSKFLYSEDQDSRFLRNVSAYIKITGITSHMNFIL